MKKSTIKLILITVGVFLILAGITIYFVMNKIKADQAKLPPVIEEGDVKTTPVVAEQPTPDSRNEVAVPILMYHHIRVYNNPEDKTGTNLSVSTENFKAQADYLKNSGYTTITFQQLLDFPTKKLPEKPIILTFDDGYKDGYDVAYRYLKENNQIGVFYIISSYLGREDQMTESQVKEISSAGMEIGSHTVGHLDLTTLSSAKLSRELVDSKSALEAITSKKVISFCYPSGKHNGNVEEAVKNSGYLTASTTNIAISTTSENRLTMSRLRINPADSITGFAGKVTSK